MSSSTIIDVHCDVCFTFQGHSTGRAFRNVTELRRQLASEGWTYQRFGDDRSIRRDRCPDCSPAARKART